MNDNDDSLRKLFDNYSPRLSSSDDFMRRLDDRLRVVDRLRQSAARRLRVNRIALAVAFLCGAACGALLTLVVPVVEAFFAMALAPLLASVSFPTEVVAPTLAYVCFGAFTLFLAFNAYELTCALLERRSR